MILNPRLKEYLDRLVEKFDIKFLSPDPLEYLHRFTLPEDQEIVGLVASSLAYGRVERICSSIEKIMAIMEWRPYEFTKRFDPKKDGHRFKDFKHRFNNGKDITCLIFFARQMLEECGTIKDFFLKGYNVLDENIGDALSSFSRAVLSLDSGHIYNKKNLPKDAGVKYFFPAPENGSPCKRLNLYLRWMIRRNDGIDFGLWKEVSPAKLIMPLDTHIARISRYIGLTKRSTPNWKMAEEITANLANLAPDDPVRYDFALSRLGILDYCPRKNDIKKCKQCPIKDVCIL